MTRRAVLFGLLLPLALPARAQDASDLPDPAPAPPAPAALAPTPTSTATFSLTHHSAYTPSIFAKVSSVSVEGVPG